MTSGAQPCIPAAPCGAEDASTRRRIRSGRMKVVLWFSGLALLAGGLSAVCSGLRRYLAVSFSMESSLLTLWNDARLITRQSLLAISIRL